MVTDELLSQHGLTESEYQKIVDILKREPNLTELGIFSVMWSEHCSYKSSRVHLRRLADERAGRSSGTRRKCGHHRYRRRLSRRLQNRIPQSSFLYRTVPGRSHRRRRHSARHLHDGRAADRRDEQPSIRSAAQAAEQADHGRRRRRHRLLRKLLRRSDRRRRSLFRRLLLAEPAGECIRAGHFRKRQDLLRARVTASAILSSMSAPKPGATAFTAQRWPPPVSAKTPAQNGPTFRSAIRSWRSCFSKRALKRCRRASIVGIQDMGAAGLTCSSCEMGARAGTGIELELDKVPQRESAMTAYEIMLSESQERMLLVADKEQGTGRLRGFHKWGLDAVTVGRVTNDGLLRVRQHGKVVAEIPNQRSRRRSACLSAALVAAEIFALGETR